MKTRPPRNCSRTTRRGSPLSPIMGLGRPDRRGAGHRTVVALGPVPPDLLDTLLAGVAQFERDLLSERMKSGLAAARTRGKALGRQLGPRPKSDRLAPAVIRAVAEGLSYRRIARDLGISKNTVLAIMQGRHRAPALVRR